MNRLSTVSSINPLNISFFGFLLGKVKLASYAVICLGIIGLMSGSFHPACAQERPRETVGMSVVAVNPSDTKTQKVEIKTYLPEEVTPGVIVDSAGLDIEFDAEQSLYYVYKDAIELKPEETKIFNIELQDVWIVPQGRLDSLRAQAESVIMRLEGSPFYEPARLLGETIYKSLDIVAVTQNDETVSRKTHIGIYRNNLQIVQQIKEDIDRLEKQLVVASSLPKPDVLEQSELKTESPTESTSWMIIFIIMLFIGMLAGVFFFTWHTQAHATKELISEARERSFPESGGSDKETS
ncbi:MAG: hypothetical protein JW847_06630 [Candidatus Omnitrophica bacterium]|nr:hypothetical protein [Candidatus Omnitrophota bacterium]